MDSGGKIFYRPRRELHPATRVLQVVASPPPGCNFFVHRFQQIGGDNASTPSTVATISVPGSSFSLCRFQHLLCPVPTSAGAAPHHQIVDPTASSDTVPTRGGCGSSCVLSLLDGVLLTAATRLLPPEIHCVCPNDAWIRREPCSPNLIGCSAVHVVSERDGGCATTSLAREAEVNAWTSSDASMARRVRCA